MYLLKRIKFFIKSTFINKKIKRIKIDLNNIKEIFIPQTDIEVSAVSDNVVYRIKYLNEYYFFREIIRISNYNKYIEECVNRFFFVLEHNKTLDGWGEPHNNNIEIHFDNKTIKRFRVIVNNYKVKNNYYLLKKIPLLFYVKDLSFYRKVNTTLTEYDYKNIGLYNIKQDLYSIAKYFVFYMNIMLKSYNKQIRLSGGGTYTDFFATYIIAEKFGISSLVTKPEPVIINTENKSFLGFVCPNVKTSNIAFKNRATPLLQRNLNSLNILDIITRNHDHGPNNYSVVYVDGQAESVCAFDNSGEKVFSTKRRIDFITGWNCSSIVKNGLYNRPYFDLDLYKRICLIKKKEIKKVLKPFLTSLQINALLCRFNKIKKIVTYSLLQHKVKLLNIEQWDDTSLNEELSGKYGKTYTYLYHNIDKE